MHERTLGSGHDPFIQRRIAMTTACHDCDPLPKHPDAGHLIDWRGHRVQVMHEGTKVLAGGYYGSWMQEIIERLQGHHEPQEELVFQSLLPRMRPGSLMLEVGSFWAYYTNWFLGAVPQSRAICVEPDLHYLLCGRTNLALNDRHAETHEACVGGRAADAVPFRRESDGREVRIPRYDWAKLVEIADGGFVDLLHVDVQGAELALLESLPDEGCDKLLRFVVVSTHHASISGSATTHRDCLMRLIRCGGRILCEHSVAESFSGDGLIVASFTAEDADLLPPRFQRNDPRCSLFGPPPGPEARATTSRIGPCQLGAAGIAAEQPVLSSTPWGQLWVSPSDHVIGASLLARGGFEEETIGDVVGFLARRHGFRPNRIVDVGANLGTHLIYGLATGLFREGVGLEADPFNYALLGRNVAHNGLTDRVKILHFPVSDRTGPVTLELSPENLGDHRLRTVENPAGPSCYREAERRTVQVVAETLDNLDAEFQLGIDPATLVWIDTQGHEGHVLKGARGLAASGQLRFVVIEFWPYGLERAGGRDQFFSFLTSCAEVYDLGQPGWAQGSGLRATDLHARYRDLFGSDCRHTDLLCVR